MKEKWLNAGIWLSFILILLLVSAGINLKSLFPLPEMPEDILLSKEVKVVVSILSAKIARLRLENILNIIIVFLINVAALCGIYKRISRFEDKSKLRE